MSQAISVALHKNIRSTLRLGSLVLPGPAVMGVLNVTPDSFSDGGRFQPLDAACRQAEVMVAQGAAIIDVGGESTRPGASEVSVAAEIDRVVPVIEALRELSDVPLSVDTSKAAVMTAAVAAGAAMINDVQALQGDGALETAVLLAVPVCLMHMQGKPRTMQDKPVYGEVVADVTAFLRSRVAECQKAGIAVGNMVVDPGFGFGKTSAHNVALLANLRQLQELGVPVLVGLSRKATLGALTGRELGDRLSASVAAAAIAVLHGAAIVRAHDVGETVDALAVASAVLEAKK